MLYIRYVERPALGRYLLVFLSLALGLMAKPMLVTLPFVLLLLDYWPLKRFSGSRKYPDNSLAHGEPVISDDNRTSVSRLFLEKIPLLILSAASCVVTFIFQQSRGAMPVMLDFKDRLGNALVSYMVYIVKMLCPHRLAIVYPYPQDSLPLWQPILCGLLLVLVSAAVIYTAQKRGYLAVGWFWYLGTLIPVIGLIQVGSQAHADRYTYLPSIGFFIMITWGISALLARWKFRKIALMTIIPVLLILMTLYTRMQTKYWRDSITLYEHALAVTENNSLMHNNLAVALKAQGNINEALNHYFQAVKINPHDDKALYNLGSTFLSLGRPYDAIKYLREALRINPTHAEAYNNLGSTLVSTGDLEEAVEQYRRALELKSDLLNAMINLADTLNKLGRTEEAIDLIEKAFALAESQGKQNMVQLIRNLLELYKSEQAPHGKP